MGATDHLLPCQNTSGGATLPFPSPRIVFPPFYVHSYHRLQVLEKMRECGRGRLLSSPILFFSQRKLVRECERGQCLSFLLLCPFCHNRALFMALSISRPLISPGMQLTFCFHKVVNVPPWDSWCIQNPYGGTMRKLQMPHPWDGCKK